MARAVKNTPGIMNKGHDPGYRDSGSRPAGQERRGFVVGRDKAAELRPPRATVPTASPKFESNGGLGEHARGGMGLDADARDVIRRHLQPLRGLVPLPGGVLPPPGAMGAASSDILPAGPEALTSSGVALSIPPNPAPLPSLLPGPEQLIFRENPMGAAFSASGAAFEFLRANVLKTDAITPVIVQGWSLFDRTVGVHLIDLGPAEGFATPQMSSGRVLGGSFVVPENKVLIVTSFRAFAGRSNPGLPGAHVEVDSFSLVGQVYFYLLFDSGKKGMPTETFVNGDGHSGTEIVNPVVNINTPVLTDWAQDNIRAVYEVRAQPFPGFPKFVGAELRGYLVNSVLFNQAVEDPVVRTGG